MSTRLPRFPLPGVLVALMLAGCTQPDASPTAASSSFAGMGRPLVAAAMPSPAAFVPFSTNPNFPLVPGTTFHYRSETPQGVELEDFIVTSTTRVVAGVTVGQVEDVVRLNGGLTEHTFDWFAEDSSGNVWYFGEFARQYENGALLGDEGSWTAGVNGAQAGIIMEANPQVGDSYGEEFAPGVAQDRATVLSLNEQVQVPYGSFSGCLKTRNFSPLDRSFVEEKYYCAPAGLVLEVEVEGGKSRNLLQRVTVQ
jgi:hypothetical protein